MKRTLLLTLLVSLLSGAVSAQLLYNNNDETSSRYNAGLTQMSNPRIAFDDVQIRSDSVDGSDSIRITKVNVGIRRLANAPATTVFVYYTPPDDTATVIHNFIKIPPVLIGSINLAANDAVARTVVLSLGDSVNTLFRVKTDTGRLYTNYQTLFLGIGFSNPNNSNGVRITGGPSPNADVIWIYNADSTVRRFATNFGGLPPAVFYLQVYGYPVSGSLPVTLSGFRGERRGDINMLSWSTLNETNNAGFEIQRSADGNAFSRIGYVATKAAGGNSASRLDYTFDDAKPFIAGGYYRILQTDKDGKATYSKVIFIKGEAAVSLKISSIYPNPATRMLNMVVAAPGNDKVTLVVSDMGGKVVIQQTAGVVNGSNNLSLNVAPLAKGSYLLKVVCANGCESAVTPFIKD